MENRYGLWRQGSGLWRSLRDWDFNEEDVWGVLEENRDTSPEAGQSMESPLPVPKLNMSTSAARMIPINSTGNSTSPHEGKGVLKQQQSAPVNIPDWSRIYGKKASSKNAYYWVDNGGDDDRDVDDDGGDVHDGRYSDDDDDDEDDDGYDLKLPPHEFLARRLARSQISSFSVFEGVGRTLKGRDLSKVRNAVLTKTGFLE
ncbi:uncharacterized protein LOC110820610 [Carica papaya]|uniref:uncharacterized protein LOC110820610 n=1 Tax=Carica papaya TaxID=3649 RepID=UPI000B8D09B7|nr:uncharacterized protein LOC110820610 [Carica papaya]XP_021905822.1 uncharacterized protein LOC110820610 [Carica papaya]